MLWIALDSETKAVLAYYVGTRDGLSGYEFIQDLGNRIKGQSDRADAAPPVHPPHRRVQQEAGEPEGDGGPVLRVVQLLSRSS